MLDFAEWCYISITRPDILGLFAQQFLVQTCPIKKWSDRHWIRRDKLVRVFELEKNWQRSTYNSSFIQVWNKSWHQNEQFGVNKGNNRHFFNFGRRWLGWMFQEMTRLQIVRESKFILWNLKTHSIYTSTKPAFMGYFLFFCFFLLLRHVV